MQVKISIISLFAIMMISGTIAPSVVFGQYNEDGLGGLTPAYVPESDCIIPNEKLTYTLDKDSYVLNDEIIISGQVISESSTNKADLRKNTVYMSIVKAKSIFITPFTDGTTQDSWYNLPEEDVNASIMSQDSSFATLDTSVQINDCGYFEGSIKLQPIVIKNGYYVLEIKYDDTVIQQDVLVFDSSLQKGCFTTSWSKQSETKMNDGEGSGACPDDEFPLPEFVLQLDKDEYLPGEKVKISGQIKNTLFVDTVVLSIENTNDESLTENKIKKLNGVEPKFTWTYTIESGVNGIGTYSVSADSHLGTKTLSFTVEDESIVTDYAAQKSIGDTSIAPKKIIDKHNRITVSDLLISLDEKTSGDQVLVPRVIQGSLFTVARGDESSINIQVSSSNGQCVIGQNADCYVNDSTREPGSIYEIVQIDGKNYKVRYNGPDVRLEKFTILPEESNTEIDTKNWNVTISKDDQPTRFYYKVSYVSLE